MPQRFPWRLLLIVAALTAGLLGRSGRLAAADEAGPSPQRPPNFLVILADDMGYSDLGCYGGEIETPALDGLAAGGLRFTQFYNTARCWPTRAALLTGYYAQQVRRDALPGMGGGSQGKRPDWAPLLPAVLRPLGYRGYHSGKWHVDGPRLVGGFDRSYSLEDHDRYFSPKNHFEDDLPLAAVERGTDYYASTAIAEHAIRCLREHAAEHAEQPFFQYVAFNAPHFPLHAPAEDIARYRDTYQVGWDRIRQARHARQRTLGLLDGGLSSLERDVGPPYHFAEALAKLGPGEVNRPLPWNELSDEQRAFQAAKMAVHAAMVHRLDVEVGRIVEQLRAMSAFDNTLVLFLSDNGASAEIMVRGDRHDPAAAPGSAESYLCLGPGWSSAANTPFRRHKTWVHEGGISTPLIAHWPSGIAARGETRHAPGHVIDIVPTILELAGGMPTGNGTMAEAGQEVSATAGSGPAPPGRALTPAFAADVPIERDYLWWLHEGNRALRVDDWKLVAAGADGPWELYDLSVDRAEANDLAAEQPERVGRMAATWNTAAEQFRRDASDDLAD
jgi:arylsulfatase A-like enzyme